MRKTTAALACMTGAIGLVAAVGLGAASASPAATSGTENFYAMTTSGTATTIAFIANGVFTASGVDHTGSTVDKVVFSTGTFDINHPGAGTGTPKVNAKTCFFTGTFKDTFTVSKGTGAYKGISGTGKVVISIVGILGRTKSGACSENVAPLAWQQQYSGVASIKL